jgi:hypothetical protein
MDKLTKRELEDMLINTRNQINNIDNRSIYSLSYYYNNDVEKKVELNKLIKAIELEILYREDDAKRAKYKVCRDRDPLLKHKRKL